MPAFDYISLANLKAFMMSGGIADNVDDTALNMAIDAACEQINGYCMRRFDLQSNKTRYYTPEFYDVVFLDDLITLTAFQTDEDGDGLYEVTWDSENYYLMPFNAAEEGEPRTWVEINRATSTYTFPVGIQRGLRITGNWGWESVPLAIQQATTILAARLFRRNKAAFGVTGSAEMGQMMVIPRLDPDVMQLIDPYRRHLR